MNKTPAGRKKWTIQDYFPEFKDLHYQMERACWVGRPTVKVPHNNAWDCSTLGQGNDPPYLIRGKTRLHFKGSRISVTSDFSTGTPEGRPAHFWIKIISHFSWVLIHSQWRVSADYRHYRLAKSWKLSSTHPSQEEKWGCKPTERETWDSTVGKKRVQEDSVLLVCKGAGRSLRRCCQEGETPACLEVLREGLDNWRRF